MEQESGFLKIKIYGTEYPIKSDPETDTEYILKVAEYVDKKMQEVDRSTQAKSALKIAILAALNITDELFQERLKDEGTDKDVGNRIRELSDVLDRALGDSSTNS